MGGRKAENPNEKLASKSPRKGPSGFDNHYGAIYGLRWDALRLALVSDPPFRAARWNRFISAGKILARNLEFEVVTHAGQTAFAIPNGRRVEPQMLPGESILDVYLMDPASIFAAHALDVQEGDRVLDLCAAPGGKSLILVESMGLSGSLIANELSPTRRARLRAVLEDYLPSEALQRVKVTGHDGTKWGLHEREAYDRVLLDAPCSGERHLLTTPSELAEWSPARSKNLSVRQYSLLASASDVVRIGGRLVYSTCSISPLENDEVIRRLLKKRSGQMRPLPIPESLTIGEATEFGHLILPDRTGFGPIFFALLDREA